METIIIRSFKDFDGTGTETIKRYFKSRVALGHKDHSLTQWCFDNLGREAISVEDNRIEFDPDNYRWCHFGLVEGFRGYLYFKYEDDAIMCRLAG